MAGYNEKKTVRMSETLHTLALKRARQLGGLTFSEYVRHLITKDCDHELVRRQPKGTGEATRTQG